jgi:[acyl-carrier-protein] S-malonyltransferase
MDIVLLFPGQGSQKPGMGKDLAEAFPEARTVFEEADRVLGISLSRLCFEGPADELTLTHNAQPALLAHGAAVWAVARDRIGASVRAAAGHSLGEFTAYHAASALPLDGALRIVRRRGELMYDSGIHQPGAMAAILGELQQPIETVCETATRDAGLVVPANYNAPGQIVISGEVAGVDRAMALAKEAGAKRAMRLNVSGAFHSPLMQSAQSGLTEILAATEMRDPRFPVYANVDAQPVRGTAAAREHLVRQLTSAVRWTEEAQALARAYPDALFVEMGPGTVLVGLMRKIAPSIRTASCGTVAEVEQLLGLVAS